jgi:periplasmic divalent cation tolerance protein
MNGNDSAYIQVQTTVASLQEARDLAGRILEKRLAACVQILPCVSMYHWQGKVEDDTEQLCLMKTRQELFAQLRAELEEVHPYEVPEIIVLSITDASPAYLAWLDSELEGGNGRSE